MRGVDQAQGGSRPLSQNKRDKAGQQVTNVAPRSADYTQSRQTVSGHREQTGQTVRHVDQRDHIDQPVVAPPSADHTQGRPATAGLVSQTCIAAFDSHFHLDHFQEGGA
jgi:hypothetical protein